MSDLTLARTASDSAPTNLAQLFAEMFRATPLFLFVSALSQR